MFLCTHTRNSICCCIKRFPWYFYCVSNNSPAVSSWVNGVSVTIVCFCSDAETSVVSAGVASYLKQRTTLLWFWSRCSMQNTKCTCDKGRFADAQSLTPWTQLISIAPLLLSSSALLNCYRWPSLFFHLKKKKVKKNASMCIIFKKNPRFVQSSP